MSKFDSFFESPPDKKLNENILKKVEIELHLNRQRKLKRRLMMFLVPVLSAAMASFFAFKISTLPSRDSKNKRTDTDWAELNSDEGAQELMANLIEEDEALEIIDELSLLENLDELEDVSDEDLES